MLSINVTVLPALRSPFPSLIPTPDITTEDTAGVGVGVGTVRRAVDLNNAAKVRQRAGELDPRGVLDIAAICVKPGRREAGRLSPAATV